MCAKDLFEGHGKASPDLADQFHYERDSLYCEETALQDIARGAGTPCYVYSGAAIRMRYEAYERALEGVPHMVCYAVKANSNLGVLALLARCGAGFDIVSAGELYRVLKAGGEPGKVVFSGVGKTAAEIEYALECGIHSFNCESESELALLDSLAARRRMKPCVALRVNPDVDAATHPYISTGLREHKFGIDIGEAEAVYDRGRALENVRLDGVSCHVGSQILNPEPLLEAMDRMLGLVERLRGAGIRITHLDFGGGLGVAYEPDEIAPEIHRFAEHIRTKVTGRDLHVTIEPGRSIVGDAGVLLTRVLYRKTTPRKQFVVVDAAMNDLIRPALYKAHHKIIPLRKADRGTIRADVVGPVCETGDFLARNRELDNVLPGDLLAICTAGAYGFVASSNYNSRPRPPEVLVEGSHWRLVRERESYEDLVRGESA